MNRNLIRNNNGRGIALADAATNTKIYNNTIGYDSSYFGGMGIFIEHCNSTSFPGTYSLVYNNTIRASIGTTLDDTTGTSGHNTGVRVRIGSKKIKIYDNDIYAYSDTISTTYYRTGLAEGVWVGYDDSTSTCDSIFIYNNTITVNSDGDVATGIHCMGTAEDAYVESYNNHIISNSHFLDMTLIGFAGNTQSGWLSHDDSLDRTTPTSNPLSIHVGLVGWNTQAFGNEFRDLKIGRASCRERV